VFVWAGREAGGQADCLEQRAGGDPNGDRNRTGMVEAGRRKEGVGDHELGVLLRPPVEQRGVRQRGVGQREGLLAPGRGLEEHGSSV